jgi:hypothetical protein
MVGFNTGPLGQVEAFLGHTLDFLVKCVQPFLLDDSVPQVKRNARKDEGFDSVYLLSWC